VLFAATGGAKLLLSTGGSDAIEIAIRLARAATRRSALLSLEDSYHGHGMGAFGLSRRNHDPRLGTQLPDSTKKPFEGDTPGLSPPM
jgi:4-aminobutyrate aminotransferase